MFFTAGRAGGRRTGPQPPSSRLSSLSPREERVGREPERGVSSQPLTASSNESQLPLTAHRSQRASASPDSRSGLTTRGARNPQKTLPHHNPDDRPDYRSRHKI